MAVGCDIYQRYQRVTDWQAVGKRVGYAWVKGTDGSGYPVGGRADAYVRGFRSVGVPVSIYHYAQFGDPVKQANLFVSEVKRLGATGVTPALDLEAPFSPNSTARSFGIRFCKRVAELGLRPAVYMSDSFARGVRPDQWGIPGLVIWIARYGSRPNYGRYDVHQYTSDGSVPGITGRVDLNESYTSNHLTSAPEPTKEWWEMAIPDSEVVRIAKEVLTLDGVIPNKNATTDNKHWTLATFISHLEDTQDEHSVVLEDLVTAVKAVAAKVDQISTGGIDYATLAKVVADELHRRTEA